MDDTTPTSARSEIETSGSTGRLAGFRWSGSDASYVVVLVHGYGEHVGRYEWLARRLVADGAVVLAHDHVGHGRSPGERVLIEDFEPVVVDVQALVERARTEHPGLPVVLVGHSMGGMIAARLTQLHPDALACTVLSGPVIGRWDPVTDLLARDEIPPTPIDPATLSRDPAVGAAYEADELVWHGDFKRPTIAALARELETITAGGRLGVPTLWLHGDGDALVPLDGSEEGWAAIAPQGGVTAASRTYPGARHEIFNETNRDEVVDDLLAFVHQHLPRG